MNFLYICALLALCQSLSAKEVGLKCFMCNSDIKGQEICATGTEAELEKAGYLKSCAWANMDEQQKNRVDKDLDYVVENFKCRKVVSDIGYKSEYKSLVTRSCAYLTPEVVQDEEGNNVDYCKARQGTFSVSSYICYCGDDKCNSASLFTSSIFLLTIMASLSVLMRCN